jgi:hypothetical protein
MADSALHPPSSSNGSEKLQTLPPVVPKFQEFKEKLEKPTKKDILARLTVLESTCLAMIMDSRKFEINQQTLCQHQSILRAYYDALRTDLNERLGVMNQIVQAFQAQQKKEEQVARKEEQHATQSEKPKEAVSEEVKSSINEANEAKIG